MATFINRQSLVFFTLITAFPIGYANNWDSLAQETKTLCTSVQNISAQDQPDNAQKKLLAQCDASTFYYGFENAADYVQARKCAFIKNDYGVLTMIYANGKGVKPDFNLAIHYACLMEAAPAETEGRVSHLAKMKAGNDKSTFDICDDITSGHMMGVCASIDEAQAEPQQKKYLAEVKQKLSPAEQVAFQKLLDASVIYFNTRVENELDDLGTGAAAFIISERMALNKAMLQMVKDTLACKMPTSTDQQYQLADVQLNRAYKKTQEKPFPSDVSITGVGIQKTERTWINYRDAWIAFTQLKCTNADASWKTLLTNQRAKQLTDLANFM
ncbi:MAG: lysozyme inhibitor LprI family protein [Legionella sp.]|uniref:lysozyme inhibitor LprI family protein n=1 Tax=Legionella sp. TaxID=459 RepID=UPI00284B2A33|nr:lysozyme inhibitor LprI family protein [Legionella sp.]